MNLKKLGNIFLDPSNQEKEVEIKKNEPVINNSSAPIFFPNDSAINTFPLSSKEFVQEKPTPVNDLSCEPHIKDILAKYEQGFNSLNLPGYDFFEFFNAVIITGPENPQVYEIAFSMGKSMEPSLTKDKLIKDAQYYLDELNSVYLNFKNEGNNALNNIKESKQIASNELKNKIQLLESQINNLNLELNKVNSDLISLDNNFYPKINDIECKLKANDVAKDTLVEKINLVKNNINNIK